MAELKLVQIPTENVEMVWTLAEDHVERAVDRTDGLVSAEQHRNACAEGIRCLWFVWDVEKKECVAAFVTEVINDVFFMWVCGGKRMNEWKQLAQDGLEQWARDYDCKGMQLWGRPGWARVLGPLGYKKTLIAMNKEF
jgi:hypothetical protein